MIYFSRRRLEAFFPECPPRRMPTVNVGVDLQMALVELGSPASRSPTDAELHRLRQVRREIERSASHFYVPGLSTGEWIYFDLKMGWGTTHEDSELPDLDDVLVFFGSLPAEHSPGEGSVDLMLCGSTEHLLRKTATAGRMGSGTEWLHSLILKINDSDARAHTEIPEELTQQALAVPRVNRPKQVARWVFRMIARHHAPAQRARVQGLARVDLSFTGDEFNPHLVVATPLYVHDASRKGLRWITRLRLHRDLCSRFGRSIWKWSPDLPPRDRNRHYAPPRGT
ncbi:MULTISPECIES: SAVMC3_10250 family protein [unclassified Streptomyces]|uniref:SAVMC3_10250 family protein n=1 Tax=unclassified Streptomyces TaxID=2593676 RepID=UPI00364FC4DE